MKTRGIAALIALAGLSAAAQADLIISEVVDADLPGGLPKFVELTNTGAAAIDLSAYSIGNFSNGGTTLGGGASTALSGMLAAGDSYVISYEASDSPGVGVFFTTYGFDPDNFDQGAFTNGDDVLALFLGVGTGDGTDATLVDLYGVIGVDGTGQVWEYTDSYAYRNFNVVSASSTFDPAQWTIAGAGALDGVDAAGTAAATSPGTHSFVPAPGAAALLAFGGLLAVRRRRA
jgi:hypothetical protein